MAGQRLRAGRPRRARATCAGKLEPAELFHEVLEHRWYMSERAGHDIPHRRTPSATTSSNVLPPKPDEVAVLGVDTVEMPVVAMFDD